MSHRSRKLPGSKLGLGTFINNDLDAKRRIVYFGNEDLSAASVEYAFTQGQTRMATVEAVLTSYGLYAALASASVVIGNSTLTNGTVTIRVKPKAAAVNTLNNDFTLHWWIVGTPDPNRIVI
jgi:hypothetical protein